MDGKRTLKQSLPNWLWLLACVFHLWGLSLYLDLDEVFKNPPVADVDYALHWAEVYTVSHFLEGGWLWGYDPYFMAGHPEGTIFDIDNKLIEVSSWLVSKSGVSLPLSYNLVILALAILCPLAVYPAVRWLTDKGSDAFIAQLMVLALWYMDPTLRWNWLGGTLAFVSTVFLSLLLLAAAVLLVENRMTTAAWLVWWVVGPLLFWLHILAFILLCLPLVWLVLRNQKGFTRRQWLAFGLWPVLVVVVNLPWLVTAVRFAWAKGPSDQFLQGGLPALAGDLLGQGRVDGASMVNLLGLRWATLLVGGLGLWRMARNRRGLEAVLVGAWMGLALAYGGLYLPNGGDLQPYRYIDQAIVWSAVGVGMGWRVLWGRLKDGVERPMLRRGIVLLILILIGLWVREALIINRPPLWGGNRFNRWYGPTDEVKAICDYLMLERPENGRLLVDDARIGTMLPWCSGVEVIGGPFVFTWTAYGRTNANMWTFLEIPYPEYDVQSWRQAIEDYNVEWLIVNTNWGVPEWYTLADWLAVYPEEVEAGPLFGKYQLYKVTGYRPFDEMDITADHGVLQIEGAEPGERVRLPYHWIPGLEVRPLGAAEIESEMVGSDPIPFIVVRPNQESFVICDARGCPER